MSNSNAAVQQTTKTTPLDILAAALDDDMQRVNQRILDHIGSDVPVIPEVAKHLIAAGGKRIRPLLTLASTSLYGGAMSRGHGLAAAVEFIHSATLLHDDVVDESAERRGKKTANLVYSNSHSVLVGDFLFARAFQLMVGDGSLDVLRVLSDAAATIAQGEVLQMTAAQNIETDLDTYFEIIKSKTAALFAASCEVGPIIGHADQADIDAMRAYGMNLGIAFQIADDALDFDARREALGKTVGDDFRERKMTAPVILALQNATPEEKEFWERTIGRGEQNEEDLQTAQGILERTNAIRASLDLADQFVQKAKYAIEKAPDHALKPTLEALITYTVYREF